MDADNEGNPIENPDDMAAQYAAMSNDERLAALIAKDSKMSKMSQDYVSVERERNQLESSIKNLGDSFEESGKGKLSVEGDKLRLEFNDSKPDVGQKGELSEVDKLKADKQELKRLKDADDISDDQYMDKLAGINAEIIYLERTAKAQTQQQTAADTQADEVYKRTWANKIKAEFGDDAITQGKPLFNEMSKVFEESTKDMDAATKQRASESLKQDPMRYHQLAQIAKQRLDAAAGKRPDPADQFGGLSGGRLSATDPNADLASEIITSEDKTFLEVGLGKGVAKRVAAILDKNIKQGHIAKDDPYLIGSQIHMES